MLAAATGDVDLVEELIGIIINEKKATTDFVNCKSGWNNETALMVAASARQGSSEKVIEVLCFHGADINLRNDLGANAFMIAAENGNFLALLKLDKMNRAERTIITLDEWERADADYTDLNAWNDYWKRNFFELRGLNGAQTMTWATECQQHEAMNLYGQTALMLACEKSHGNIVYKILELYPFEFVVRNKYCKNAIIICAEFGVFPVLSKLLSHLDIDAKINVTNAEAARPYTIGDLVRKKIIKYSNTRGLTGLIYASGRRTEAHVNIVTELLDFKGRV